jgi:hypothetical protein
MYEMPTLSTQNHTVTNHSHALNVVDLIIVKTKKSKELLTVKK